jgi:arginyl-tRNA synthetase
LIKQTITDLLRQAAIKAQELGKLPAVPLPEIVIEHPQKPEHGDYATSFAMKLSRTAGIKPLTIAKEIAELIPPTPEIEKINVAPPGYINITLGTGWMTAQVDEILRYGDDYGNTLLGKGSRVQIEFVSVNPTGPLHIGHGRGAVLGATLARVLAAAGYSVEKEYYINDTGSQIEAFYRSLYARYRQCFNIDVAMPANGYLGNYMVDLAKEIIAVEKDRFLSLPEEEAVAEIGKIGLEKMIGQIRRDLELLGVTFDVWFSEKSLYKNGEYDQVMTMLRRDNHLTQREGATWFVSSAMGEDKDNVVIRTDGTPTYFASDIAYHYNKFMERRFDRVINIWGADHQGHISRMKAVISALGIKPERLQVIISQMVTLSRGGELVKISKRSGELITLHEVVDEVGADACLYFFASRTADSQMEFDLDLAKKQSADNPVYYVQYAHARIASILRLAKERNIDYSRGDVFRLTSEPELALIRKMIALPETVEMIAQAMEPHHLAYYATDLATLFHSFYKQCRVVTDDADMTAARLKLVEAAKIVLAKTLSLMGMSAPDGM